MDYNNYYVSGEGGMTGYCNGADRTTLPIVTDNAAHSLTINPLFDNSGGTFASMYIPTVSLPGITGTGVTADIGDYPRAEFPTMGAWEKNYECSWNGSLSTAWDNGSNWSTNNVPTFRANVTIPKVATNPIVNLGSSTPAVCNNLIINSEGQLTIAPGKALTVNGNLTNNGDSTALVIQSDATGAGSLKILGTVSAQATVERYLSMDKWHLITSPTTSPIIYFLNRNRDIAVSAASGPFDFAMSGYSNNAWPSFFHYNKPISDQFEVGKGYRIFTIPPMSKTLYFAGALNTLPINPIAAEQGWNLVGNPYTSAININAGGNDFLSANTGILPPSFTAAYFWDAASNSYIVVNKDYEDTYAQIGQGFFVRADNLGTITFNSNMQVHDGSLDFKGSALPRRPTIKLIANSEAGSASTLIKFMDSAHEGLDVGYDAGIFKANPDFSIFTRLVEDNGIEFQLQYLPTNKYDKLIIPVGSDSKAGGEIVFTVKTDQLDPVCKTILEDRLTNTFTDLSKGDYKVAVVVNTSTSDRFFLHTGDIVSGVEDQVLPGKLTAFTKGNREIRLLGEVGEGAVATLFNGLGKVAVTKKLVAGKLNIIGLPNLKSGLYVLNINDKGTTQTIKVMIKK